MSFSSKRDSNGKFHYSYWNANEYFDEKNICGPFANWIGYKIFLEKHLLRSFDFFIYLSNFFAKYFILILFTEIYFILIVFTSNNLVFYHSLYVLIKAKLPVFNCSNYKVKILKKMKLLFQIQSTKWMWDIRYESTDCWRVEWLGSNFM